MPTHFERTVREVLRQGPGLAEPWGVEPRDAMIAGIAAMRLEGGWGDEPGVGDGGRARGWWQWLFPGGVGGYLVQQGIIDGPEDALDPVISTRISVGEIARHMSHLEPDHHDRLRTAIYNFEKPKGHESNLPASQVYVDTRWLPALAEATELVDGRAHHDPTFRHGGAREDPPAPVRRVDIPPNTEAVARRKLREAVAEDLFAQAELATHGGPNPDFAMEAPPPPPPPHPDYPLEATAGEGSTPGRRDVARNAVVKGTRDAALSFAGVATILTALGGTEALQDVYKTWTAGEHEQAAALAGGLVFAFAYRFWRDTRS